MRNMSTYKAFKFRLKPTAEQTQTLVEWMGISRWIWNHYLDMNKQAYQYNKTFMFKHDMIVGLPRIKKAHNWVKNLPSQALQQKCMDLDTAIKSVFKLGSGFPKFKSRDIEHHNSFRIPNSPRQIKVTRNHVKIPKLGWVNWIRHRPIEGSLKSITIKLENGFYWCVCLCQIDDVETKIDISENEVVGIDLGIKEFAITSDGETFDSITPLRNGLNKLKRAQRAVARKQKGGKNRLKARKRLNKLHNKIKNQRKDLIHKVSSQIANVYEFVMIEDLNVSGMMKNHNLARSIADQGWSMFVHALTYKMAWNGGGVTKIGRFMPSSKTCSRCDNIQDMPLSIREYNCPVCGTSMDRDINAAVNIKRWGIKDTNRTGTVQIHACGDTSDGEEKYFSSSQVLLKQEKYHSAFGNGSPVALAAG